MLIRQRIVLHPQTRRRLLCEARRCTDAALRTRYMIVVHTADGKSGRESTEALGCSDSTVRRVRRRWRQDGEAGLIDRREDNRANATVMERYVTTLQ